MKKIDPILERLRDKVGVKTDKELCEKVEIMKYATLDTWKNRDRIPPDKLRLIAKELKVDPLWLEFGENNNIENSELAISKSHDDSIVIEYRSNAIGGCGSGQAVDQVDHKWLTFSKQLLRGIVQTDRIDELHMIDSFGNSMEPTIKSGEKLFVLPFEKEGFHIREGSVYIIFFAHGVMVKRIYFDKVSGGLKLSGDNKSVSPEEIYTQDELEALTIYGRVVGHMGGMG